MSENQQKTYLENLVESTVVFCQLYSFYMAPVLGPIITLYIFFYTAYWPLILLYFSWMYLDRETPKKGGRSLTIMRNLPSWKYIVDYFPQKLVKTQDLDLSSNYIFCMFPHGLLTTAALSTFTNDISQATKLFPGFSFSGLTLNFNFYVPFFRELSLGYGLTSVSKESMMYQLNQGKSKIVVMYPGGSAEAAKTLPGSYRVAIKNRKGFVKLAIKTGSNLVPLFAFGETDLFNIKVPKSGSKAEKVQAYIRRKTGIALCNFSGRGLFGLLPLKKPVTTVVGKPVIIERNDNPSSEEIDRVHQEFLVNLVTLFEEHKGKYLSDPGSSFLSIED